MELKENERMPEVHLFMRRKSNAEVPEEIDYSVMLCCKTTLLISARLHNSLIIQCLLFVVLHLLGSCQQ